MNAATTTSIRHDLTIAVVGILPSGIVMVDATDGRSMNVVWKARASYAAGGTPVAAQDVRGMWIDVTIIEENGTFTLYRRDFF